MPRRGTGPEVVVISWRDIPAQVNGQAGRERHQVVLSAKFQRAIDRAKRKAGIYTADDDIAQWRRVSTPCGDDIAAAADAEAQRLEQSVSRDFLGRLAYVGGFEADLTTLDGAPDDPIDRKVLLALEELDEQLDEQLDRPDTGNSATSAPTGDDTA